MAYVFNAYVDGTTVLASDVRANHGAARDYANALVVNADFNASLASFGRAHVARPVFQANIGAGTGWFESGDVSLFRRNRGDAEAWFATSSEKLGEQEIIKQWRIVEGSGAVLWSPVASQGMYRAMVEVRCSLNERYPVNATTPGPPNALQEAPTNITFQNNSNIANVCQGFAFEPGSDLDYGFVYPFAGGADSSRHRVYQVAHRVPLVAGRNAVFLIVDAVHERVAVRSRSGWLEDLLG